MRIGNREIGPLASPLVIAEMSGNHRQSLDRALALVDAAADAGAGALKLQTYTPDTMTLDLRRGEFVIDDPESLWAGRSLYELYAEASTPWEWHAPIFERCRRRGLLAFSTPFDETAVDFLESLDVPCYKIASFENTDLPLIRKAASTGKPLIISTGMASISELDEAVREARRAGCDGLALLKCTSSYPASPVHSNLRTLPHLKELFGCEIGVSDHTLGVGAAVAAVALGASIVEKHFTLSRAEGGVDSAFSLEPAELRALAAETERAWQSLGEVRYGPGEGDRASLRFRRSLYVTRPVRAGEPLTPQNMRAIRPGLGLPPKYFEQMLGKRVNRDLDAGMPLTFECIA